MKKTFITEYEKKCCQAVKELFQFYSEQSDNVYISDCGKYGFCFYEEFSNMSLNLSNKQVEQGNSRQYSEFSLLFSPIFIFHFFFSLSVLSR